MAVCGNCGQEGARVRSRWVKGIQLPDECPQCAPQSFEGIPDPSSQKIWIGPEYAPNDYEKRYDKDGVYYMPKPEIVAEHNARALVNSDEKEAYEKELVRKRSERRLKPLKGCELEQVLRKVDELFRPLVEDPNTSYDC